MDMVACRPYMFLLIFDRMNSDGVGWISHSYTRIDNKNKFFYHYIRAV
jgi:hypothetical protein